MRICKKPERKKDLQMLDKQKKKNIFINFQTDNSITTNS
jgi:hypothetical protein